MKNTNNYGWQTGIRDTPIAALNRAVAAHPTKIFLDFSGSKTSYYEFDRLTNRLGHALIDLGVNEGDTVVSLLDNNIDAVSLWIATNKILAVSAPLNTSLVGDFLRHQIEDSAGKIMICEAHYVSKILEIENEIPTLELILCRGSMDGLPTPQRLRLEPLDEHRGSDESAMPLLPNPAALNAIIYTSGTTGPSKGCMISGNQMCYFSRLLSYALPVGHEDIVWTPLPYCHMNAICTSTVSVILAGATLSVAPRFSVSGFWPAVEASGATIVSILGGLGNMLAHAEDNDAMKRCFGQVHTLKGNPFSEDIKEIWRTRFGTKHIGSNVFGQTEALFTSIKHGTPTPPGSSGKAVPEFDVRIFDDFDNELPTDTAGEVVVRPLQPDIMFKGFWRRPAATQAVMGNLWFHTGDIGKFDQDGFFYFVDRKKDYLRRRGENISSFEMESTFLRHPAIAQVAVHAVPAAVGEDDLKVTARLKDGHYISEEELCQWVIKRVPHYAVPRYIEFRSEMPTNPQGRVLKYLLRDEGVTPTTWDLETTDIKAVRR